MSTSLNGTLVSYEAAQYQDEFLDLAEEKLLKTHRIRCVRQWRLANGLLSILAVSPDAVTQRKFQNQSDKAKGRDGGSCG
jgi:hypothetical protein